MKRILLFALVLSFAAGTFAQRVSAPKAQRDQAVKMEKAVLETNNLSQSTIIPGAPVDLVEEAQMGMTRYDLQTNSSMQQRIHYFDDGTIGGVWTHGLADPGFAGRGTGYNYFDGSAWGPVPTERIEGDRTGWPAYAPYGENGEVFLAHYSGASIDGLAYGIRTEKGTGDWELNDFFGPAGGWEGLLWPRLATGGVDNSVLHFLPITRPVGNGGLVYEGIDGAILYSRSTDGGATWDPQNVLLDDVNSDYYLAISGDTYEIQANGDNVAFLFGESFTDLTMMKSTDGGTTWTKTIIWECPYPLWDPNNLYATDTFYCADGAHSLAIDNSGLVHVAFGINRAHCDGAGTFWFPLVDGLGYWNENRATFSNDLNSLNPYDDAPYTELVEDYSLVGWAQDVNGNGEWDILGEVGSYFIGTSSMPTIHVDDQNQVFIVWAGITETFDNGSQDFRHLWARMSPNGGEWWGGFHDLTSDLIHIFDECVFPSLSQSSDDFLYLNYQFDQEPGLAVRGDEDEYTDNTISFMKVDKNDLVSGIESHPAILDIDVAQNQPNPFSGNSTVYVNLRQASDLSLEVTNMMGQVVYRTDAGQAQAGLNKLSINGSELASGVYFYTVNAGEAKVTRKMIVE